MALRTNRSRFLPVPKFGITIGRFGLTLRGLRFSWHFQPTLPSQVSTVIAIVLGKLHFSLSARSPPLTPRIPSSSPVGCRNSYNLLVPFTLPNFPFSAGCDRWRPFPGYAYPKHQHPRSEEHSLACYLMASPKISQFRHAGPALVTSSTY